MLPLLHHQNRVTGATSWGRLLGLVENIKVEDRQLWGRPMGGLNSKLQAASYVRDTHRVRLFYTYYMCNMA